MKRLIANTALIAAVSTAPVAMADYTEAKQGAIFSTTTIAGAVLGGPVGMMIGALSGAYLGEKVEQADQAQHTELELAETQAMVAELQQLLTAAELRAHDLQQVALQKLEFDVLFHTGEDTLNERGQARVSALSEFLLKNPQLNVRLDGHADPRGTDEYNNVLSLHRAITVQQALETDGISGERITIFSHGSDYSTASKGNMEDYAMERRVDIEVYENSELAQIR